MKKFLFVIFVIVFFNLISGLSIGDFFSDLKENPHNYYVIYNENNDLILQNSISLAETLGVEFSSEFIENKNYILVIVPPNLLGHFYWYENNFSYVSLLDEEVNILMIYLSDLEKDSEIFSNEVNLIFNDLKSYGDSFTEDFYLFQDFSFKSILKYSCQGFSLTSIFEKNSFEFDGNFLEDVCLDDKTLLKMDCVDSLVFNSVSCENSCFEGRCLEKPLDIFSVVRSWVKASSSESYFQRFMNLFRR